jgi:hypothetical protein
LFWLGISINRNGKFGSSIEQVWIDTKVSHSLLFICKPNMVDPQWVDPFWDFKTLHFGVWQGN